MIFRIGLFSPPAVVQKRPAENTAAQKKDRQKIRPAQKITG
jgi:hypothetical protein